MAIPQAHDVGVEPSHAGRYEVTVDGPLGPVLRRALAPCEVTLVDVQTVLRAVVRDEVDTVDVVDALQRAGVEIADVVALR